MSYEQTVRQYLREFQRKVVAAREAGATSLELPTRPVVHNFITKLVEQCSPNGVHPDVIHEVSAVSYRNRPDWRVANPDTFGVYCFGDHKNLSQGSSFRLSGREPEQIERYLDLGNPVFVFDGVEFLFFYPGQPDAIRNPVRESLVPKPLDNRTDWSALPLSSAVEECFRCLLEQSGTRRWTEVQLVEQLARRARLLSQTIEVLLAAPPGSGVDLAENTLLDALHGLQKMAASNHDPTLRGASSCADFIAQVLVFGLFFAHTQAPRVDGDLERRRETIRAFWLSEERFRTALVLRPFVTITRELTTSLKESNDLAAWYSDVANLLAHAEYTGTIDGPRDFHSLFESFLTAFNPQMRFDRGAFYTPDYLAEWIAKATDRFCTKFFGAGVALSAERVIDPCCGTGGFLEALVGLGVSSVSLPPLLIGLEVLPAPYALANYRLSRVTHDTCYADRVCLMLTDTLSDHLVEPPARGLNGFSDELATAAELSKPPIQVVIGNPPSSIQCASTAPRTKILEKLDDFRPPPAMRGDRQNVQKALNNEAYLFLRWCADRILATGRGVLSLVLPGSFVHSVSTKFARKWLAKRFDEIWVLELDADSRRGGSSESVFKVLQGRAIMFAVKRASTCTSGNPVTEGAALASVHHLDICGMTLDEKKSFLSSVIKLDDFSSVSCEAPDWLFAPSAPYPRAVWGKSMPLLSTADAPGMFRTKCSGVKLAPTSVLFHSQESLLVRRAHETARKPFRDAMQAWYSGQQKPPRENKITEDVKRALANSDLMVTPYTYRPFLYGSAIVDPRVIDALRAAPGDGFRMRPEVQKAFAKGAQALIVAPAPRDLGETMSRFVSFAPHLPDNDNAARGNGMVYCDLMVEGDGRNVEKVVSNVSSEAEALFAKTNNPAQSAMFYAYAVLNCQSYLEAFEPILYTTSNPDFPPRVPIASDVSVRHEIARLGREAAECESPTFPAPSIPTVQVRRRSADVEFPLKKYEINPEEGTLALFSDASEKVQVIGVPAATLLLRVSGHDVVQKWLRERKYAYLRRKFNESDLDALLSLINRIHHQQDLLLRVDKVVASIIEGE